MCDCLVTFNRTLAERCGYTIRYTCTLKDTTPIAPLLSLEKTTNKRGRKPIVTAAFCPFCGQRLRQDRDQ